MSKIPKHLYRKKKGFSTEERTRKFRQRIESVDLTKKIESIIEQEIEEYLNNEEDR